MAVDDKSAKLMESMGAVFQQKGLTETPRALVEATLANIKTIDDALADYETKSGGDFANRRIQLSYGKGALEYLLIFL